MEGATRFRGHRPYSAARPPGARSATDPSTCQRAVCRAAPDGGKSDPSRARDTRVDDRDDRGGLPDCARWRRRAARTDRRRAAVRHADEQYAWPRSHDGADREEAAAAPAGFLAKRRVHDVGAAARSDWTRAIKPWHNERRLARSVGASRRSPRVWRYQLQALTSSRRSPSAYRNPHVSGGARRQLLPGIRMIATAAERLQDSSTGTQLFTIGQGHLTEIRSHLLGRPLCPDFYVSTWSATLVAPAS